MEGPPHAEESPPPESAGDQGTERPDRTLLAVRIIRMLDQQFGAIDRITDELYPPLGYPEDKRTELKFDAEQPINELNEAWAAFCRELTGVTTDEWARAERLRDRERDRERPPTEEPPES